MYKQACMCTSRSLIPNSFTDPSLVWRHSSIQKLIFHKYGIQHQWTKTEIVSGYVNGICVLMYIRILRNFLSALIEISYHYIVIIFIC